MKKDTSSLLNRIFKNHNNKKKSKCMIVTNILHCHLFMFLPFKYETQMLQQEKGLIFLSLLFMSKHHHQTPAPKFILNSFDIFGQSSSVSQPKLCKLCFNYFQSSNIFKFDMCGHESEASEPVALSSGQQDIKGNSWKISLTLKYA